MCGLYNDVDTYLYFFDTNGFSASPSHAKIMSMLISFSSSGEPYRFSRLNAFLLCSSFFSLALMSRIMHERLRKKLLEWS